MGILFTLRVPKSSDRTSDRTSVIFGGEPFLVPTFRYLPSWVVRWFFKSETAIGIWFHIVNF